MSTKIGPKNNKIAPITLPTKVSIAPKLSFKNHTLPTVIPEIKAAKHSNSVIVHKTKTKASTTNLFL